VVPHIVHGAQVGVQVGLLGHQPDALANLPGFSFGVVVQNPDVTSMTPQQPGDQVDGSRLARPVGPQQAKELTALHLERQVVHSHQLAETVGDRFNSEHGLH